MNLFNISRCSSSCLRFSLGESLPEICRDARSRAYHQRLDSPLWLIISLHLGFPSFTSRYFSLRPLIAHPNRLRTHITQKVYDECAYKLCEVWSLPLRAAEALNSPCQRPEALPYRNGRWAGGYGYCLWGSGGYVGRCCGWGTGMGRRVCDSALGGVGGYGADRCRIVP